MVESAVATSTLAAPATASADIIVLALVEGCAAEGSTLSGGFDVDMSTRGGGGFGGLNSLFSLFGFNFRRDEQELAAREPAPFSTTFEDADSVSKREPFGLDAFVRAKRGY